MSLKWDTGAAKLWNGSTFTNQTVPAWTFASEDYVQPTLEFGFGAGTSATPAGKVGFDDFEIVKLLTPPAITTQPVSQSVTVGSAASLSVSASGESLSYQWYRNAVAISGATTSTYAVSSFALADEGIYDVKITNSAGSIYSDTVLLIPKPTTNNNAATYDFAGTTRDTAKWGVNDFNEGAGRYIQNDKLFYYTQGAVSGDDLAARGWHVQALPYSQDWSAQVDVNLPNLTMSSNNMIATGLFIFNQDDHGDNANITLYRDSSSRKFEAMMEVNGNDVLELTPATTSTTATLRLRWVASEKKLYFEYDANGANGGYSWSTLTSKSLNTGSTNWGMNANSSFVIALETESENITITQANNVWLDNFKISGNTARTAAVKASGYSFTLGSSGGVYFTTYDGSVTATPKHDGSASNFIYSGEARPTSVGSTTYQVDGYASTQGAFLHIPDLKVTQGGTDSDNNGIMDFLELNKASNVTISSSGSAVKDVASSQVISNCSFNGSLVRSAGKYTGTYSGTFTVPGYYSVYINGIFGLAGADGSVTYTPGSPTINLSLSQTYYDDDSKSFKTKSYIGSSSYTIGNENLITLPEMTLNASDGNTFRTKACTLIRSGNVYRGALGLYDGNPRTSWADYIDYRLEITDTNDSDGDGIPDMTDSSAGSTPR